MGILGMLETIQMHAFDAIDEQVDLLENLNRRLEELVIWDGKDPAFGPPISALHNHGAELGEDILAPGQEIRNLASASVSMSPKICVREYETLWIRHRSSTPLLGS